MPTFRMSKHALSRAVDMAVEAHEIRDAVERPRESFDSSRTLSTWLTRGRVTVCTVAGDDGVTIVTTVMWAKPSGWVADQQFEPIKGREQYTDAAAIRRMVRAQKRNRR